MMKNRNSQMSFSPTSWRDYFDSKEDLEVSKSSFRVYRKGVDGPLILFLHGGGFSALSWANLTKCVTERVRCQCLAFDLRGHGDTRTPDDTDLSAETLSNDIRHLILSLYPSEAPPIIMVGHSMGGAVAVHAAFRRLLPSLVGIVVIDVVEGSAMEALNHMRLFLKSRPSSFASLEKAIEWCYRSSHVRNLESARVSFPGQVVNAETRLTAVAEMDAVAEGAKAERLASERLQQRSLHAESIAEEEAEEEQEVRRETPPKPPAVSSNSPASVAAPPRRYVWRIDLASTECHWRGWFKDMTEMFLSVSEAKLLLLAGVDRLDKNMTIAHMQGKFQMHVLQRAGHAVHEDVPEQVAECLCTYLTRNRFAEPLSGYNLRVMPTC